MKSKSTGPGIRGATGASLGGIEYFKKPDPIPCHCPKCSNFEKKGETTRCKCFNIYFPNRKTCVEYFGPKLTEDMANLFWKGYVNKNAKAKANTEAEKITITTDEIVYSDCQKCSRLVRTASGRRCGLSNERFPNKRECEQYNGPEVPKHMASQIWRKNEMANARSDTKARTIIIPTVHSNCPKCFYLVRTASGRRCRYYNILFPNRKKCKQYILKSNCDCQQCSHFNAEKVTCKCYDNFLPARQRCLYYDGPTLEKDEPKRVLKSPVNKKPKPKAASMGGTPQKTPNPIKDTPNQNKKSKSKATPKAIASAKVTGTETGKLPLIPCDCQQCSNFNAIKVTCKCYDNFSPMGKKCAMYDGPSPEKGSRNGF